MNLFKKKLDPEARTAQILSSLIIPGHLIFFFTIYFINQSERRIELSACLVIFYLTIAFIQV